MAKRRSVRAWVFGLGSAWAVAWGPASAAADGVEVGIAGGLGGSLHAAGGGIHAAVGVDGRRRFRGPHYGVVRFAFAEPIASCLSFRTFSLDGGYSLRGVVGDRERFHFGAVLDAGVSLTAGVQAPSGCMYALANGVAKIGEALGVAPVFDRASSAAPRDFLSPGFFAGGELYLGSPALLVGLGLDGRYTPVADSGPVDEYGQVTLRLRVAFTVGR